MSRKHVNLGLCLALLFALLSVTTVGAQGFSFISVGEISNEFIGVFVQDENTLYILDGPQIIRSQQFAGVVRLTDPAPYEYNLVLEQVDGEQGTTIVAWNMVTGAREWEFFFPGVVPRSTSPYALLPEYGAHGIVVSDINGELSVFSYNGERLFYTEGGSIHNSEGLPITPGALFTPDSIRADGSIVGITHTGEILLYTQAGADQIYQFTTGTMESNTLVARETSISVFRQNSDEVSFIDYEGNLLGTLATRRALTTSDKFRVQLTDRGFMGWRYNPMESAMEMTLYDLEGQEVARGEVVPTPEETPTSPVHLSDGSWLVQGNQWEVLKTPDGEVYTRTRRDDESVEVSDGRNSVILAADTVVDLLPEGILQWETYPHWVRFHSYDGDQLWEVYDAYKLGEFVNGYIFVRRGTTTDWGVVSLDGEVTWLYTD